MLSNSHFAAETSELGRRYLSEMRTLVDRTAAGLLMAPAGMLLAPLVGWVIDGSGGMYRHTFTAGCILAMAALATAWHVHRRFMKLGGPKSYIAPE